MLKQGLGRTDTSSGGHLNVLVVAEVALSLMLLVGAGLMIRSLWNLRRVDTGFDPHNILTMTVSVPPKKFPAPAQQSAFFERLRSAIAALPGVESAGVTDNLPTEGGSIQPIQIEGRPVVAMADQPEVPVRSADPGYFRTLRIPLLSGRLFTGADNADSHPVGVISQALAHRFWPDGDPIGKHFTRGILVPRPVRNCGRGRQCQGGRAR